MTPSKKLDRFWTGFGLVLTGFGQVLDRFKKSTVLEGFGQVLDRFWTGFDQKSKTCPKNWTGFDGVTLVRGPKSEEKTRRPALGHFAISISKVIQSMQLSINLRWLD